jgi:DNA-directed RNA polymerase specialized sigma subunit
MRPTEDRARGRLYPIDEMYALYEQGATLREVGERFGISGCRVSELFNEADLQIRPPGRAPRREYPVGEMYALYQQGASLGEVGERFGVAVGRVPRLFKEAGLPVRPRGTYRRREYPVGEMYALYQQGASLGEVGERFGISLSHLSYLFRAAGLRVRPRGRSQEREYPVGEMYALYQRGVSLKEVGERFRVSESHLARLFGAAGLRTRPRGRSQQREYPVAEMYAVYQRGASLKEVGRQFSVSASHVGRLFEAVGLKTRPAGSIVREYPVGEMYAIYQQGALLREVGERFGVSSSHVARLFAAAGLEMRAARHREYPVGEMYALYQQGASLKEASGRFGVAESTASKLFSAAGLPARAPGRRREREYPVGEMYALYERGMTLREVGRRFRLSHGRLRELFTEAGLETRPTRREYPIAEMYALYEQGVSLKEIGKRFEVSESSLSRLFRAAGLSLRAPGRHKKREYPVAEMYALYEQGTLLREIGERFGVSDTHVSRVFKAAGRKTYGRAVRCGS